jgi:hypothetical protein
MMVMMKTQATVAAARTPQTMAAQVVNIRTKRGNATIAQSDAILARIPQTVKLAKRVTPWY